MILLINIYPKLGKIETYVGEKTKISFMFVAFANEGEKPNAHSSYV